MQMNGQTPAEKYDKMQRKLGIRAVCLPMFSYLTGFITLIEEGYFASEL
jgi:hypothetical protein